MGTRLAGINLCPGEYSCTRRGKRPGSPIGRDESLKMITVWVQIPPWTQSGLAVSGQNKTAHAFGRNWVWASW